MSIRLTLTSAFAFAFALGLAVACGDDEGTEADELGVGAECAGTDDCHDGQSCLTQFKGGYCGEQDCASDHDCPEGAACVAHTDGNNYCFLFCHDKSECNRNRGADNESNCSANIDFVDAGEGKACVPPSA